MCEAAQNFALKCVGFPQSCPLPSQTTISGQGAVSLVPRATTRRERFPYNLDVSESSTESTTVETMTEKKRLEYQPALKRPGIKKMLLAMCNINAQSVTISHKSRIEL